MEPFNEQETEGLDFRSLSSLKPGERLLSSIDYTRPLGEYPSAGEIADFLNYRKGSRHIYTKDLNNGGIAIQDSMDKYLSSSDYYSSGALKEALKSPLNLFFYRESGWREELEKYRRNVGHFELGTFLHESILEPTKFSRVVVEPKYALNSKDGVTSLISYWIDKINELHRENAPSILSQAQEVCAAQALDMGKMEGLKFYYQTLKQMSGYDAIGEAQKIIVDAVHYNYKRYGDGMFYELLKHSKREISLYYTDPVTGIQLRCRPDAMQFAENIGTDTIISVKSTRQENLDAFYRDTARLNYELSEGLYQDVASGVTGRDFRNTIMIMVQSVPPFGVAALVWNGEDIELGKYKYRMALQTIAQCQESGLYPGFDSFAERGNAGLIDMKQPDWNKRELLPVDMIS